MTNEERDIITRFIERVSGAQSSGIAGSVPATTPALPPVDREADTLIGDMFQRYPDARYRLTQTAFVQEHALAEAQNRIKRLEWELEQARQAPPQASAQPNQSRGFFGGLFGGGQSAPPPQQTYQAPPQYPAAPQYAAAPPPPQYAPGYQPGLFQRSGSGFLGSALTTAAGVAGGMVVGNALMDMFSPHHGFGGGLGGPGGGPESLSGSPWGGAPGAGTGAGGWDAQSAGADPNVGAGGGWDQQAEGPDNSLAGGWDTGQGGTDNAGWDQGGADNAGLDQGGGDAGGGWDQGGGDTGGGWDDNT